MKRILYASFILLCSIIDLFGLPRIIKPIKRFPTAFAIIVDTETYNRVGESVKTYRDALENDGLSTYIVIDDWGTPEIVKDIIQKLYQQKPILEGIVLVGDIPIPMIRDAQHLTSAFKMDQERFPYIRSSVPSDRFYDDFDLKFNFLEQDTINALLFYYSLAYDSPQFIENDIYSGRIIPPVDDDSKYKLIRRYLLRVSKQKSRENELDNILTYTGHGYISESLSAWEGELFSLREQFPQLFKINGVIKNLNHTMSSQMKGILISEMQKPELDIAIFHAHGAYDTQYLLGYPPANNINQNIESIKLYLRSKLRQAKRRKKSVQEAKAYFIEKYAVPENWFEGSFVDSIIIADSIFSANLDIYSSDIEKISPQAKFIMFDECFNGAFIRPNYIAGTYVFGNGNTVACVANSVNVKQDIWADEFIGLLNYGVRVGQWQKTRNYLESHIIGDPTFHFKNESRYDLNHNLVLKEKNLRRWRKLLRNGDYPLRTIAVAILYKNLGSGFESDLVNIYKNDLSFNVRLEVLKCLADLRSETFNEILFKSVNDPYELIRRVSVNWMGIIGKDEYLPILAEKIIDDPSKRISFAAKSAIEQISADKAKVEIRKYLEKMPELSLKDQLKKTLKKSFERSSNWLNDELLPTINNDTLKVKKRVRAIRAFRNYNFQDAIIPLINIAKNNKENAEIRVSALEALGWFTFTYNRSIIISACEEISNQKDNPVSVAQEAFKTKKRLLVGANNPITP